MTEPEKKLKNKARCRKCHDVIESKHRHDFRRCYCGAIFVDGGNDYCRYGGYLEDFEWIEEEVED